MANMARAQIARVFPPMSNDPSSVATAMSSLAFRYCTSLFYTCDGEGWRRTVEASSGERWKRREGKAGREGAVRGRRETAEAVGGGQGRGTRVRDKGRGGEARGGRAEAGALARLHRFEAVCDDAVPPPPFVSPLRCASPASRLSSPRPFPPLPSRPSPFSPIPSLLHSHPPVRFFPSRSVLYVPFHARVAAIPPGPSRDKATRDELGDDDELAGVVNCCCEVVAFCLVDPGHRDEVAYPAASRRLGREANAYELWCGIERLKEAFRVGEEELEGVRGGGRGRARDETRTDARAGSSRFPSRDASRGDRDDVSGALGDPLAGDAPHRRRPDLREGLRRDRGGVDRTPSHPRDGLDRSVPSHSHGDPDRSFPSHARGAPDRGPRLRSRGAPDPHFPSHPRGGPPPPPPPSSSARQPAGPHDPKPLGRLPPELLAHLTRIQAAIQDRDAWRFLSSVYRRLGAAGRAARAGPRGRAEPYARQAVCVSDFLLATACTAQDTIERAAVELVGRGRAVTGLSAEAAGRLPQAVRGFARHLVERHLDVVFGRSVTAACIGGVYMAVRLLGGHAPFRAVVDAFYAVDADPDTFPDRLRVPLEPRVDAAGVLTYRHGDVRELYNAVLLPALDGKSTEELFYGSEDWARIRDEARTRGNGGGERQGEGEGDDARSSAGLLVGAQEDDRERPESIPHPEGEANAGFPQSQRSADEAGGVGRGRPRVLDEGEADDSAADEAHNSTPSSGAGHASPAERGAGSIDPRSRSGNAWEAADEEVALRALEIGDKPPQRDSEHRDDETLDRNADPFFRDGPPDEGGPRLRHSDGGSDHQLASRFRDPNPDSDHQLASQFRSRLESQLRTELGADPRSPSAPASSSQTRRPTSPRSGPATRLQSPSPPSPRANALADFRLPQNLARSERERGGEDDARPDGERAAKRGEGRLGEDDGRLARESCARLGRAANPVAAAADDADRSARLPTGLADLGGREPAASDLCLPAARSRLGRAADAEGLCRPRAERAGDRGLGLGQPGPGALAGGAEDALGERNLGACGERDGGGRDGRCGTPPGSAESTPDRARPPAAQPPPPLSGPSHAAGEPALVAARRSRPGAVDARLAGAGDAGGRAAPAEPQGPEPPRGGALGGWDAGRRDSRPEVAWRNERESRGALAWGARGDAHASLGSWDAAIAALAPRARRPDPVSWPRDALAEARGSQEGRDARDGRGDVVSSDRRSGEDGATEGVATRRAPIAGPPLGLRRGTLEDTLFPPARAAPRRSPLPARASLARSPLRSLQETLAEEASRVAPPAQSAALLELTPRRGGETAAAGGDGDDGGSGGSPGGGWERRLRSRAQSAPRYTDPSDSDEDERDERAPGKRRSPRPSSGHARLNVSSPVIQARATQPSPSAQARAAQPSPSTQHHPLQPVSSALSPSAPELSRVFETPSPGGASSPWSALPSAARLRAGAPRPADLAALPQAVRRATPDARRRRMADAAFAPPENDENIGVQLPDRIPGQVTPLPKRKAAPKGGKTQGVAKRAVRAGRLPFGALDPNTL